MLLQFSERFSWQDRVLLAQLPLLIQPGLSLYKHLTRSPETPPFCVEYTNAVPRVVWILMFKSVTKEMHVSIPSNTHVGQKSHTAKEPLSPMLRQYTKAQR